MICRSHIFVVLLLFSINPAMGMHRFIQMFEDFQDMILSEGNEEAPPKKKEQPKNLQQIAQVNAEPLFSTIIENEVIVNQVDDLLEKNAKNAISFQSPYFVPYYAKLQELHKECVTRDKDLNGTKAQLNQFFDETNSAIHEKIDYQLRRQGRVSLDKNKNIPFTVIKLYKRLAFIHDDPFVKEHYTAITTVLQATIQVKNKLRIKRIEKACQAASISSQVRALEKKKDLPRSQNLAKQAELLAQRGTLIKGFEALEQLYPDDERRAVELRRESLCVKK